MDISTDIITFIPQRPPFVMVDQLTYCDDTGATTKFVVRADNIFLQEGLLTEPALVENIAQTAAARMGYICQQEHKPVPVGFIGVVQNLSISSLPHIGKELNTRITIKNQIFNATIIEGLILVDDTVIAQCEMKIFLQ